MRATGSSPRQTRRESWQGIGALGAFALAVMVFSGVLRGPSPAEAALAVDPEMAEEGEAQSISTNPSADQSIRSTGGGPRPTNAPPRADAGPDRVAYRNQSVTLDGSLSLDPDGDALRYTWTQLSGPRVTLSAPSGPTTLFVPAALGAYSFQLTVRDNGSSWGTAVPIGSGLGDAQVPQVCVNPSGHATAVWSEWDGTRFNVWANRFTPAGGWGVAGTIEAGAGDALGPQVAVDSSGNAVATWHQWDGTTNSIWANTYGEGSGWDIAVPIETAAVDARDAEVAVGAAGDGVAVWRQLDGTQYSIRANEFTLGIGWGTAELIEGDPGEAVGAQVAIDPKGNAFAVWEQSNGSHRGIWSNQRTAGAGWGAAMRIESASYDTYGPEVATDPAGNAIAVWREFDGAQYRVAANRFNASGWGTETWIAPIAGGQPAAPDAELAVDASGNAIAVWWEIGPPDSVWASRYVRETGTWEPKVSIVADTANDADYPQVGVSPAGSAVAVWHQKNGTLYDAWANRYEPGTGWQTAVLIETSGVSSATYPQVAVDSAGGAVAVWREFDGAWNRITANRFDASASWDLVNVTVVNQVPVAGLTATPDPALLGDVVLLDASSSRDPDGFVVNYTFLPGDGSPPIVSATPFANHMYAAPGAYTASVAVVDGDGALESANTTVDIVVDLSPIARIAVAPGTTGTLATLFTFDGTGSTDDAGIVGYLWNFGDGATDPNAIADHAYAARGAFTVSLTVWDAAGQNANDSLAIRVENRAPTARATATPPPIFRGTIVILDASGSSDPDGDALTFEWSQVGGPSVILNNATAPMAEFLTPSVGDYVFRVDATDTEGAVASAQVMTTALGRAPIAALTANSTAPRVGIPVSFDGSGSSDPDGTIVDYRFDFGDGTPPLSGTSPTRTHPFSAVGVYDVSLTATDDDGNTDTAKISVTVSFASGGGPPGDGTGEEVRDGAIIGLIVVVIAVIVAALWRFRVVWLPHVFYWLYTKLRRDEVLDNFTRGEIYGFIRLNPGESYSDIKRSLGLATGPLTYHLAVLERMGLIRSVPDRARKLFYPTDAPVPRNGGDLRALQTRILRILKEDPGIVVNDLAALIGVSRHVALYHLRKLVGADQVRLERKMARLRAYPLHRAAEGRAPVGR